MHVGLIQLKIVLHNKLNNVEVEFILKRSFFRIFVFFVYLAEMKQRSASLDHSAYAHRRHLQHRATVTIRTPYRKI